LRSEYIGDRDGEPVERDYGCLIMAALVVACGIVTAILIYVSTRS
jgi:hypothetical protein